ncbi:N-acyl-D-aspartate/D-glutamate deacylase, partial [Bacillus sp. S34]|nr:N-acyl-D-aspartate/D-glutamate deacylase [Bacillus sp. S34]
AGTVRHEVIGDDDRPATPAELEAMRTLVCQGLAEGAAGLATGLDYVPGLYADTAELAALCTEVAAADGLYVSHMRGGYEGNARAGLDEIADIVRASGVRAHVSHLHAPVELAVTALAAAVTYGAVPGRVERLHGTEDQFIVGVSIAASIVVLIVLAGAAAVTTRHRSAAR